ncbi:hypothetical protein GCM10010109_63810 [Actinoplanes campanulatus]|nr:hypothetical protein GCM10010109_63810 [Actinoplanes campanulatus]GID39773.1 hypothetical protein Aca09nite_62790 [Actinoplanes campanulatus]
MATVAEPGWPFDAIVVGEFERAFSTRQFKDPLPVFDEHGPDGPGMYGAGTIRTDRDYPATPWRGHRPGACLGRNATCWLRRGDRPVAEMSACGGPDSGGPLPLY